MSASSKGEKSSGSRMLKKAKSFRDDVRHMIRRRPSASNVDSSGVGQKVPKSRPNPINVSWVDSPIIACSEVKQVKEKDAVKLEEDVNKVDNSLKYIRAVIGHEKMQVIPTTASIVLESIMDVVNNINNLFLSTDSSTMLSHTNRVCQCLAKFIRWSDDLMVRNGTLDKTAAYEIIDSLWKGIQELKETCLMKLADRKNHQHPHSPESVYSGNKEMNKRSSLPDLPLTPREKNILAHTSELGIYDNAFLVTSHSSDSIINNAIKEPSPPPKPPLPKDKDMIHMLVQQRSLDNLPTPTMSDTPPPIPNKENRHSLHATLDMLSSKRPNGTNSQGNSPHNSAFFGTGSEFSSSLGLLTPGYKRDQSVSPSTTSPGSSFGSGLNRSAEDLIDSANSLSSSTFSKSSCETQIYSASASATCITRNQTKQTTRSQSGQDVVDQINHFKRQMNQLPSEFDSLNVSKASSTGSSGFGSSEEVPPIPTKKLNRLPSQYDNMFESMQQVGTTSNRSSYEGRTSSSSASSTQSQSGMQIQKSNTISFSQRTSSQDTYSSSETFSSASHSSLDSIHKAPPLPPKKKHIQDYIKTFGSYTQPMAINECMYSRHSLNFYETKWQQSQRELHLYQHQYPRSNTISVISDLSSESSFGEFPSSPGIPSLPLKRRTKESMLNRDSQMSYTSTHSDVSMDFSRDTTSSIIEELPSGPPMDMEQKRSSAPPGHSVKESSPPPVPAPMITQKPEKIYSEIQKDTDSDFAEINPLDDIDVSDQLIKKKEGEDGPDIRGGSIDALVVHATTGGKSEFMYQEAFLTTYRTFISPPELIDKILYRFNKFQHAGDTKRKGLSKNSFSLLVRVVDELGLNELDSQILQKLMDLVFELLCQGDLMLARILRKKIIEKCSRQKKKSSNDPTTTMNITSTITLTACPADLLHFKSQEIAEQMTLLDAALFQQIEIPELLLYAKEQSEELSPNLTEFTEHFNKVSYWCRTQVLTQDEPKEREKYLMKFIKIMKHLRKFNNFNSYLAILSAVDSGPVRRLEWQKQNLEALKEFCELIDSSASFKAYRQALSETEPPCIPYIGMILQDLFFINIGNPDSLPDGSVNFAKRWQQFNVLDSMRRFKKCNYEFKKNEKILSMFNNFDEYLCEESLWQISEKIKPRMMRSDHKT